MSDPTTQEVFQRLRALEIATKEIHTAVVGNEELGHEGLVASVKDHSRRIATLENWRWWAVGGTATMVFVLQLWNTFGKK